MTPTNLLTLASVLAAQFAICEAALRWKGGSEAAPAFQVLFTPDDRIGYRLKPGSHTRFTTSEFDTEISVNTAGVRGDEIGPKADGERRIAVLGDSLVLAVQVPLEQTFCSRLESRLNLAAPRSVRYRVINAGVQGYGPVEERLFFDRVIAPLKPDVVVIALFVGNDAVEAADSASRLAPAPSTAAAAGDSLSRWMRRTTRRSMVLQTVRMRAISVKNRFTTAVPERPLASYLAAPPPEIARGLQVTKKCVAEIAQQAAALGARTVVLLMPARFQLDGADYGRLAESVRPSGSVLVRDAATERFAAALADMPVPRLDLLPELRSAPAPQTLFFQTTMHFTPRGHEVVAEALERFLRAEHLVS